MSRVESPDWGVPIACAVCGTGGRTNVLAYIDGSEPWICVTCSSDGWDEDDLGFDLPCGLLDIPVAPVTNAEPMPSLFEDVSL